MTWLILSEEQARQTFFGGTNKENTNHLNKIKIKRKMNDAAPLLSFQLCSCKVDNKIQQLDRKKSISSKRNTTKLALRWLTFPRNNFVNLGLSYENNTSGKLRVTAIK